MQPYRGCYRYIYNIYKFKEYMKIEAFKELGLTGNEGKVYDALVKHGKMGSIEISSRAGVSYGRIYDILNSLISKGLVKVIPDKTKKFVSTDPEAFLKLVEKKESFLQEIKQEIKEMKKFYDKESDVLVVAEGDKGFWKIVDEMNNTKEYAYDVKWVSKIRPESFANVKKDMKKKIDLRILARYDNETKKDVDKWKKINPNIKKISNEGVAMSIKDDKEIMIGLIKSNMTLLIRDKAFVKMMKKMFLQTYNSSLKI